MTTSRSLVSVLTAFWYVILQIFNKKSKATMAFCRVAAIQISYHSALTFPLKSCGIALEVLAILWTQQRCSVVIWYRCRIATDQQPWVLLRQARSSAIICPGFFRLWRKFRGWRYSHGTHPWCQENPYRCTRRHQYSSTNIDDHLTAPVEVGTIIADAGVAIFRQIKFTLHLIFFPPSRFQACESRSR